MNIVQSVGFYLIFFGFAITQIFTSVKYIELLGLLIFALGGGIFIFGAETSWTIKKVG